MNQNNLKDCPALVRDFLFYMETIKGLSSRSVDAYYTDLHTFFRFMKMHKLSITLPFAEITIADIDLDFIRSISLSDIYEFLNYVTSERNNSAVTRAHKVTTLRSFYKYLTVKANLLEENIVKDLDVPSRKKSLPRFLTLEQSEALLDHVDTKYSERDYCILTLFLNCGMRLSELVGINLKDLGDKTIRVLGKGNKERMIYLNDACIEALDAYLKVRPHISTKTKPNEPALFLSRNGKRIDKRRVQQIVSQALQAAGLSDMGFSTHKLRHTAATLLYQKGHVDIRVLKEILGHVNIGTTEIYTHVSNEQIAQAADLSPLAHVHRKKEENT